jgi:starch phosphorylase
MLRALGYKRLERFHINEGHSAFLAYELLRERRARERRKSFTAADIRHIKERCVFTTHTCVPAGHDVFSRELVQSVFSRNQAAELMELTKENNQLNMTRLALNLSGFVNGVAVKHAEVARGMFPKATIHSITNGVHAATWTSPSFQALFDKRLEGWRRDNGLLRNAMGIPLREIGKAHDEAKRELIRLVAEIAGARLNRKVLTLGFARRFTQYKRPALIFEDADRLAALAARVGRIQLVFSGKAHPKDAAGLEHIARIHEAAQHLGRGVRCVYLENYGMATAAKIVAGVDVWLNNPVFPLEASGTSGMKAALNGVPSLSVLDGWWLEGCIEGVTGWSINRRHRGIEPVDDPRADARSIYEKLELLIAPMFYEDPEGFLEIRRNAIALNGPYFNTQRMMDEYVVRAYYP